MLYGVNLLESILGRDSFMQECSVILTDRGTEFSKAEEMEMVDELRRTRVFYCDPMQSSQKGSIENKHHLKNPIAALCFVMAAFNPTLIFKCKLIKSRDLSSRQIEVARRANNWHD